MSAAKPKIEKPCFFDIPFNKQVEAIIASEDLKLLQAYIGIRNPIALLQYNSSFICTKIALMDTRLHGLFKVQEKCLEWYKQNVVYKECEYTGNNSNLYSSLISDASQSAKKELFTNILLPIYKKNAYDSISNSSYIRSSNLDWELLSYVRNTEISRLCCINIEQVDELYKAFVSRSRHAVQNVIEESLKDNKHLNDELLVLKSRITDEQNEIAKYKDCFKKIKNRAFLRDWYAELLVKVNEDAKTSPHLLHEYLPDDLKKEGIFMDKLKNQYSQEIVKHVLSSLLGDECSRKDYNYLMDLILIRLIYKEKLDYDSVVDEVIKELRKALQKPNKKDCEVLKLVIDRLTAHIVMKAEQAVLNDILKEALKQEKVDSVLLLLCNGADINLFKEYKTGEFKSELEIKLQQPGFSVVENLYSCMPLITAKFKKDIKLFEDFTVAGVPNSSVNSVQLKLRELFDLEDIKDTFPANSAVKRIADNLSKSLDDKANLSKQIDEKEELIKRLDSEELMPKVTEFMQPWWRCILTIVGLGLPLVGFLMYEAGKSWNTKRNTRNELEIAQEDLKRVTKLFEAFLEYLQSTIVGGSTIYQEKYNLIKHEIEIIKKNKKKWVNLTNVLSAFENIQLDSSENLPAFVTKSIKFSNLAEDIICNRMRYMDELGQPSRPSSNNELVLVQDNAAVNAILACSNKKADLENQRNFRKEADVRSGDYATLLRQLQRGDLSPSDLQNMKFE